MFIYEYPFSIYGISCTVTYIVIRQIPFVLVNNNTEALERKVIKQYSIN